MRSLKVGLLSSVLLVLNCESIPVSDLTIATAANMQFAMEVLLEAFTEKTGITGETVVSSSGKLTAQIRAGAPFHLFVSADLKYPEALHAANLTLGEPRIYAHGQLVLWTCQKGLTPQLETLTLPTLKHIALANPKTAPYGRAAEQVLARAGLASKLRPKFVYGESIAQTNQFILSGAAEIGFTALSVLRGLGDAAVGEWAVVPADRYDPIVQAAVVLRSNPQQEGFGKAFIDFLLSETGQAVLEEHGYLPPLHTVAE